MTKKSSASVLLLVLFMTSTMLILSLATWHKMALMTDLVLERERFYKNFYCTEAILNIGLTIMRENFDALMRAGMQQQMPMTVMIDPGVRLEKSTMTTRVLFDKPEQDDTLIVHAFLYDRGQQIAHLGCLCSKKQQKGNDGKQKEQFLVHHFTIGGAV